MSEIISKLHTFLRTLQITTDDFDLRIDGEDFSVVAYC